MPPPVQCGARIDPARARPVPFWRHGLAPPPRTLPRVLVACVPCRRAASSARTDACTRDSWNSAPNAASSSSTVSVVPRTVGALAIGTHPHHAVARAGDGAAHHEQVALGVDLHDGQPTLGDALVAHLTGALDALHDARRRRRGSDRARRAHVVRAVGLGTAREAVTLDGALEALALRGAGHLHGAADLERLDRHGLTDRELARLVAELDDVPHRRGVGLAQVPELGPGQVLLLRRAQRALHGPVAGALAPAGAG